MKTALPDAVQLAGGVLQTLVVMGLLAWLVLRRAPSSTPSSSTTASLYKSTYNS